MNNQKELTEYLIKTGVLKTKLIIEAFLKVDRVNFLLDEDKQAAYVDHPLVIGFRQTISQPTVVAFMLELISPKEGERILDIGSGSGWTTALLAECVGQNGSVIGTELVPELVKFGQLNLQKYNYPQAKIVQATKEYVGLPDAQPFDKVLVSASASSVPDEIFSQFNKRLVIPVQSSILSIDKDLGGKLATQEYYGFSFVPLVTASS